MPPDSPFVPPEELATTPSPWRTRFIVGAAVLVAVVATVLIRPRLHKLALHVSPTATTTTSTLRYLAFNEPNGVPTLAYDARTKSPVLSQSPTAPETKAQMAADWDKTINKIGQKGDGVHTQLGFWLGPFGWDLTDAAQRQVIDDAFALAEERGVAVGFHIDDEMFWLSRKDLWGNPKNVEWGDWKGTVVPHRIIGWVEGGRPVLAPPMCYNSPAIAAEAARLAREVIGPEIKKNVERLNADGKGYLFMGVIAGWETQMQDGSTNPHVDYGYCALTNLGYSATKPPADADKVLNQVVADWIVLWTKNLAEAGIPREKIFTHLGTIGCTHLNLPPGFATPAQLNVERTSCHDADPELVAFNQYSNPGFTAGKDVLPSIYKLMAMHGNPPWGVSEYSDPTSYDKDMEGFLAGVFNHGGLYVNIFVPEEAKTEAPWQAYKKFFSGATLSE